MAADEGVVHQVERRKPFTLWRPKDDSVPAEVAEPLLEWLAEGRSLTSFCAREGMPCRRTIYYWRDKDPLFRAELARAWEIGCDVLEERRLQIARTRRMQDPDDVQHRKLLIDTIDKTLANRHPSKYGTKARVEHTGQVTLEALVQKSLPPPAEGGE